MKKAAPSWRTRVNLPAILLVLFICAAARGASILKSVHNLSASGPGTVIASTNADACVFCHTMHQGTGVTPLWNHTMSSVSNYVVYSSARFTNLNIVVPQPNGSSRLCLSCHDGTVALGSVSSEAAEIQMRNSVITMPVGANNLGTDLSSDHPISFFYDTALAARDPDVKDPSQLPAKVRLDSQNRLQCTACHNPHDNQYGNFLVMDNTGSALCTACHQLPLWGGSPHAVSPVMVPASISAKVATKSTVKSAAASAKPMSMSSLGCANCHANHKATSRTHLMHAQPPEQNCLNCHNGVTSKKNIAADFQKSSIHPITLNSDAHFSQEDPVNPKVRHVVCADCHNAHAANKTAAVVPNAAGALAGLTGVTAAGGVIKPLLKEYELCYRCHADSSMRGPAVLARQNPQTNTRLQFSPGNQSFHPVEAVGKNLAAVPSLILPLTVNSRMYCTDCHNSDSSSKTGGFGANGPHGSIYRPILERNLELTDGQPESIATYALCYKCHDRNKVLSNASFPFHQKHVVDDKTACTTCHDSHGVANNPGLINFNTTYATASSNGRLEFNRTGPFRGNCSVTCHGKDHVATAYPTK